jgi:hypothetical protein
MPLPEEQVWRRRARDALERDGSSLEGALGSRSRRGLMRWGRPALKRGGVPLEGASDPRARWNLTVDGVYSYQSSYGFASRQIPRRSQGTLLLSSGEAKVSNP